MAIQGLNELMIQGLQAVYDGEQQGSQAAAAISDKATNPQLKQLLQQGSDQAKQHLQRVEQAITKAGGQVRGEPNAVVKGIVETGNKIMNQTQDPDARDAGIIASGQIAAHYYIAAYGTLRSYADTLGNQDVSQLAQSVLDEFKQRDQAMTQLATQVINPKAA